MRNPRPLVIIGDALLDRDYEGRAERLAPEGPVPVVDEMAQRVRPGGAGLAALLAAFDGREVALVTALGRDDAGRQLAACLESAGVRLIDLGMEGTTPEKIRVRSDGRQARFKSGLHRYLPPLRFHFNQRDHLSDDLIQRHLGFRRCAIL